MALDVLTVPDTTSPSNILDQKSSNMAKRKTADNPLESSATFEESLEELQTIVSELEEGAVGLEASLARFERGIGLLRVCYSILESAEAKVEVLTRFQGEQAVTVPFENSPTFDSQRDGNSGVASDNEQLPGANSADGSVKSSLF